MADSFAAPLSAAVLPITTVPARHSALIRVTHWVTVICFLALLVTGVEILLSHPRFYWGEAGNVNTPPLFQLHIPASRSTVPTGYAYVLPDQNGWSRYLHFQSAWLLVFTGFAYAGSGVLSGHFRRRLLPSYNALQRLTYFLVIFFLFPMIIWTGLAMSPGVVSAFPVTVTLLGGQQSARTIHFFVTISLVLFLFIHVAMVCISGFRDRMRAITLGGRN